MYNDVFDTIQITNKKLLHFKLSKSGQNLCVDKIAFSRPGHIFNVATYIWPLRSILALKMSFLIVATYCHLILIALGVLS